MGVKLQKDNYKLLWSGNEQAQELTIEVDDINKYRFFVVEFSYYGTVTLLLLNKLYSNTGSPTDTTGNYCWGGISAINGNKITFTVYAVYHNGTVSTGKFMNIYGF